MRLRERPSSEWMLHNSKAITFASHSREERTVAKSETVTGETEAEVVVVSALTPLKSVGGIDIPQKLNL